MVDNVVDDVHDDVHHDVHGDVHRDIWWQHLVTTSVITCGEVWW